ncbi:Transmembrane protein 120B [Zea mays]|uniref:Transmembrane protein 120B n=1 Tax=Zea mays TaxID=4577 RepID=A0A3L6ENC3_MAIZE|nr:Transmembrane protein 120B [Zea mays]
MSGDGDARGLEAAAATAAEAARELREAAAALVATRAAEEDALRRRAVALEADVRRLQASLHALDPSTLDKVEEELERARVAITDSDVASFLPSKRNGKFLKTFLGPVNVRVARKEDKLKIKDEYNNYRDRTAYKFLLFPSILLLLRWWIWDGCLPALAVQIYQAWLLYLYTSFALRENVLIANGSDIRPWWIYHHYLAMLMALISLTWEIKGQPDCSSKQRGVQLFLRWAIMQGIAMHLQNRYQRQRLRTRIALGKVNLTSLPINKAKRMDVVAGETAGVEGQLLLLYPVLFILQGFEAYVGVLLLQTALHGLASEWQARMIQQLSLLTVLVCGILLVVMAVGNFVHTMETLVLKLRFKAKMKKAKSRQDRPHQN